MTSVETVQFNSEVVDNSTETVRNEKQLEKNEKKKKKDKDPLLHLNHQVCLPNWITKKKILPIIKKLESSSRLKKIRGSLVSMPTKILRNKFLKTIWTTTWQNHNLVSTSISKSKDVDDFIYSILGNHLYFMLDLN